MCQQEASNTETVLSSAFTTSSSTGRVGIILARVPDYGTTGGAGMLRAGTPTAR